MSVARILPEMEGKARNWRGSEHKEEECWDVAARDVMAGRRRD
jgi:hypothetical protein